MKLSYTASSFLRNFAVVRAPSLPDGPSPAPLSAQDFVACDSTDGVCLPALGAPAGWFDCGNAAESDRDMTFAGVESAIGDDADDLEIGLELSEKFGYFGSVATSLAVNSEAWVSVVFSSILMCFVHYMRRLESPCFWAFHSPSPSTF